MIETRLQQRVTQSFTSESAPETIRDALDTIRVNWRAALLSTHRSWLGMLALAALFVLITEAVVARVGYAGFEIRNVSPIQKALPAITAVLMAEGTEYSLLAEVYAAAHKALCRLTFPSLSADGLDDLLAPPAVGLWAHNIPGYKPGTMFGLLKAISLVGVFVFFLGFEFWAFRRLFKLFGSGDVLVWASLGLAVVATLQIVFAFNEYRKIGAFSFITRVAGD